MSRVKNFRFSILDFRFAIQNPKSKIQNSVVCAVWFLSSLLATVSVAGAHSEEAGIAVKTYTPVTVDGKLDDWVRRLEHSDWSGRLQVKKGDVLEWMKAPPIYLNTLTSHVEAGAVNSPDDLSAKVYLLWDDAQLYVAAVVTDDQVVTEHEGDQIWQDDAVELWLDCRHDAVTHTLFQDDEYQIGISPASRTRNHAAGWAWRNPAADRVTAAMRVDSSLTEQGYIVEASVPWKVLEGCHPAPGGMIGFNLSIVDKDADQLWTHLTWSGRLHSDPSQFGHLYFVDAPIDLFPSDVFETTPDQGPWTGGRHE